MHLPVILSLAASSLGLFGGVEAWPFTKPSFNWDSIKHVYAFGDSYTFVGGTAGRGNFSFIGDALNFSFTPKQILTNQIIPKNTSSEGSNWTEFLTGCFSGSPFLCKKQLWNFAFAGADIDSALLPLHHDYSVDLVDQVRQWITYASKVLPHPSSNTLTMWWIGINDTGDTVNNATITDFTAFWETEMTSYFNAVQLTYQQGMKKHLFINVPPEERSPNTNNNATKVALQKEHINLFNGVLAKHVSAFEAKNRDAKVITFDAHTWFNTVLDAPATYGFTNVTGFCTCKDPGYFWYNGGHPTELVHKLLAEAITTTLKKASSK